MVAVITYFKERFLKFCTQQRKHFKLFTSLTQTKSFMLKVTHIF